MKRIGLLTAGGDTPALNATIQGVVTQASLQRIEVLGFIKGFNGLRNPRVPHIHLNPLFQPIPEIDDTIGGTLLGASRDYLDADDRDLAEAIAGRLARLGVEGLICVGGDGTLNGMQALTAWLPVVLAPKTIDNDLGLNYRGESAEWTRLPKPDGAGWTYGPPPPHLDRPFDLEDMVNFVTPGYATAVFVAAGGVERIRTTAESHRRVALIEVMGRHSGYLALGSAYGQPDLILIPESPVDLDRLVEHIKALYEAQKNVVIVCGEGIVGPDGHLLGEQTPSTDPAGNKVLTGAAEVLRHLLIERIGDRYFKDFRRGETAAEVIFTRKVGHTQRGGWPVRFDRFYAAQLGAQAVELLLEGRNNFVAVLQWSRRGGFSLDGVPADALRDRWGHVHARHVHPAFYDPERLKPSPLGIEYLEQIFTGAVGHEDTEHLRALFEPGRLRTPYRSTNAAVGRRIRYLDDASRVAGGGC